MKKVYKRILRVFLTILVLHIALTLFISAAFVAMGMGEYGQPRFLEHNGCPGGDIQVRFCLMRQTIPEMMFGGAEIRASNIIQGILLNIFT